MDNHILTMDQFNLFRWHLKQEDREQSTIEKYLRDLRLFAIWLAGRTVTAEVVADWKNYLRTEGYKSETINSKLSSLNKFFTFMQWPECRMKYLKIQRKMFRSPERELAKGEYLRLLETADALGESTSKATHRDYLCHWYSRLGSQIHNGGNCSSRVYGYCAEG